MCVLICCLLVFEVYVRFVRLSRSMMCGVGFGVVAVSVCLVDCVVVCRKCSLKVFVEVRQI